MKIVWLTDKNRKIYFHSIKTVKIEDGEMAQRLKVLAVQT